MPEPTPPQLFGNRTDLAARGPEFARTFLEPDPNGNTQQRLHDREVCTAELGWAAARGETDSLISVVSLVAEESPFVACAVASNVLTHMIRNNEHAAKRPTSIVLRDFMLRTIEDDSALWGEGLYFSPTDLSSAQLALLDWPIDFQAMKRAVSRERKLHAVVELIPRRKKPTPVTAQE